MKAGNFIQGLLGMVACSAILLTAVSCDDEGGDKTGNGGGKEERPTENPSGKKLVSKIENDLLIFKFSYDGEGRLTWMSWQERSDGEPFSYIFTQTGTRLVVTADWADLDGPAIPVFSGDLDDDGYIVSAVSTEGEERFSCECTYRNGYLESYQETTEGVLQRLTYEWDNSHISWYTESGNYPGMAIYTFTDRENKMNIDPAELLHGTYGWSMMFLPFSAGYLGKKNKCLIEKYEYTGTGKAENYTEEFTYELDKDGYVTGFTIKNTAAVPSGTHTSTQTFDVYY